MVVVVVVVVGGGGEGARETGNTATRGWQAGIRRTRPSSPQVMKQVDDSGTMLSLCARPSCVCRRMDDLRSVSPSVSARTG